MKKNAVSLLVILVVAIIVYFIFQERSPDGKPVLDLSGDISGTSTDVIVAPIEEKTPETATMSDDLREYKNVPYRFSLLYPKNLEAREYKEKNNAVTVTFQDPETNAGFQVFATPYSKDHIDDARFKLDQPSGVIKDPKDVVIDGARATMFFGRNSIMGDTREVWFIKNKFLYEVTTYKELDEWLGTIMKTWKFQ